MILSGRDIKWYILQGMMVIKPVMDEQFQQNGVDLILAGVDHGGNHFRQFQLGTTREHIELPNDLMAFVELRSTWARTGLVLPPTIVDAGFKGTLTLEIGCLNDRVPICIPYGQRFAHLIFAKMTGPSEPYVGKYQNQRGIVGPLPDK